MISYDIRLNGMQLNRLINRYGYETGLEPVEGSTVTTLDTVDHLAVVRYRNTARLKFDPMDQQTLADIATAIKVRSPVEAKLFSLQTGEYVLCNVRCSTITNSLAINTTRKLIAGFEIEVTEL